MPAVHVFSLAKESAIRQPNKNFSIVGDSPAIA